MAGYRLGRDADEDVRRLYRHGVDAFGLVQADRYFEGLVDRLEHIASHPLFYREVREIRAGYRRSVYGIHAIYYRIEGECVEILRVLGREDPTLIF